MRPTAGSLRGCCYGGPGTNGEDPNFLIRLRGQVCFEYVASGTEILFRDHADPAPRLRRVFHCYRPETLRPRLAEPSTIRARPQTMPPLVAIDRPDCQIEA